MNAYFIQVALSYLNIPYIYGGKNPLIGLDCSGYVCEVLKAFGVLGTFDELGSQELHAKFASCEKTRAIGALSFYGTDLAHVDHVALHIDDHFVIEAGHGTAQTTTKDIAVQRGAFVRVRPHDYRKDYLETLLPIY